MLPDNRPSWIDQRHELGALLRDLQRLEVHLTEAEERHAAILAAIRLEHRPSALNLLRYRVASQNALAPLEARLAALGVASIAGAKADVLGRLQAALRLLRALSCHPEAWVVEPGADPVSNPAELLRRRAHDLFGPQSRDRGFRVMLTLPSSAHDDPQFVRNALTAGVDCVRINCAHDGPETWERIILHVRRAERELGRRCAVLMDLAGPKLRTGSIEPGPAVVHWKPVRDALGRVRGPARIWLSPWPRSEPTPPGAMARLLLPEDWLAHLRPGDVIGFVDARDARRRLHVEAAVGRSFWALSRRTSYVVRDTAFSILGAGRDSRRTSPCDIATRVGAIRLHVGDVLDLLRDPEPGIDTDRDGAGLMRRPARISCTLPEVLDGVQTGEPVWFDDGRIGGFVCATSDRGVRVEITRAKPGGAKLRSDRGINFPESNWRVPALTNTDIAHLSFVARHADLVGLSFVQCPEDVFELRSRLRACGGEHLGVLLKVETRNAAENLDDILLAAFQLRAVGVMIARGDLAVECGWERLAVLQEEILSVCAAAHVPVVWATQVLESLAKNGVPSRPEITDAAMGGRASCVMLNKGPHVMQAVEVLNAILAGLEARPAATGFVRAASRPASPPQPYPVPAWPPDQPFGGAVRSALPDGSDTGWPSDSNSMDRRRS